jgi:exoribonuclease-2
VLERLDAPLPDAGAPAQEEQEDDDDEVAGPIAIAVDMGEPEAATGDNPA